MVPRGRSAMAGQDSDRSYDSSPDPLALSFDDNNASARKFTPRRPSRAASPTKQNQKLETSEMMFSSPSKSMVMSTPRGGGASPWRIKVTVQAEPGSDEHAESSPSVKRVTRTKTTTVPLKDHDTQSPVNRPRGRPRKSDVGESAKPKRKGSPVKRPAPSASGDAKMRAGESSAADVDTDVAPKRRRGRPRKSVQPPASDDIVVQEAQIADHQESATPEPTAEPIITSSPKSTRFESQEPFSPRQLPSVDTPAQQDLSMKLRERKGTPHAKNSVIIESDEEEGQEEDEDEDSGLLTPTSGEEDGEAQVVQDAAPQHHPERQYTRSQSSASGDDAPSASDDDDAVQAFEDEDMTKFAFDEGTTRMPDDTTVLDSENFSMISVDSLPSNASPPKHEDAQKTAPPTVSLLKHEYLGTTESASSGTELPNDEPNKTSRPPLSRYKTPVLDTETPVAPPAIEKVQSTVPKPETPGLGRALTAGVALQGLLDPNRLTPEPSQKANDRLDHLFRGFSTGTRKELQADLRLGEQLAKDETEGRSARAVSKPTTGQSTAAPKGVFRTQRKYRESRLLTPEDQDHVITTASQAVADGDGDVEYPALNVEEADKAPPSPARSENEMSWQADPPATTATSSAHVESAGNEHATRTNQTTKPVQQDDYADIWQEEASRSSESLEADMGNAEEAPQLEDVFTEAIPARGKLPRTWRRRQQEETRPSQTAPQSTGPTAPVSNGNGGDQAEDVITPLSEDQPMQEGDESSPGSEASDDTGMFFQSNMPNVFKNQRASRFEARRKRRATEKQSLAALVDESESLLPESSPATKKSPPTKNPFMDTPPRFPALMSSPKKSSPLRRELHSSDLLSSSQLHVEEESTLPLAQSSPFRTIVDGESMVSAASDQRQFRREMEGEGDTASTIVRVRHEADEYLEAYETQERSLHDVTEVTEPSRTMLASSPPKMQGRFTLSLLSSAGKSESQPSPLRHSRSAPIEGPASVLSEDEATPESSVQAESIHPESTHSEGEATPSSSTHDEIASPERDAQPSLLSRVTSTFARPSPPAPHPILSRLTPLPKIEPWTRTHYKALDKLYTTHLKHPSLFNASASPPTPLSNTNGFLLRKFIAANHSMPYVGATFHAWGYSMLMTEELVVLCAVFVELMSLNSVTEYEAVAGKRIQLGDCAPGRTGDVITGEEVLRRLATVVMGESVRRDEREGREIDRNRGLEVEWPVRGR